MNGEQIHEEGIVIEAKDGKAKVELHTNDACEECTAKVFCKPKDENANVLEVRDPIGVKPGDEVTINIEGSDILRASLKLYGIPLLLVVAGIILGSEVFKDDILGIIMGLGSATLYYFGLYFVWKRSEEQVMPTIISVKLN